MWSVRPVSMARGGGVHAAARRMSSGSTPQVNVAVVGGSGYTGAELIRMLAGHPYAKVRHPLSARTSSLARVLLSRYARLELQVRVVTANAFAGRALGDVYPHLAPFARANNLAPMCKMDEVDWSGIDVAFTCLPHAITQQAVVALPRDLKIVDLSADFRLRDAAVYEKWYDTPHEAPEHLAEAGEKDTLCTYR